MKWLSVVAAVVLVVLVMHPGGGSTLDFSPLASCTPDCSGVADGGKVPDPLNCTNYYYCMGGSPVDKPNSCGTSQMFDPEESKCVADTGCSPSCSPGGDGCHLSCDENLEFVGDATDCSRYYVCSPHGVDGPFFCFADQPYFDGTACVNDESGCCSGYCKPYCDGRGVTYLIPDPEDCTRFYICDEATPAGPPDSDKHYSCDPGEVFDVPTLQCVAGNANSCTTLCDAATGGGGGTITPPPTTTWPSSGCVSSLTCLGTGYYAACDTCVPYYYLCDYPGAEGVLETCPSGSVFNPNPQYPICVLTMNCPYYP